MQFLSPALLWALAALAVPILLHLFYFRRFRRVEFSNVRFLREVKEETQSRSRLRNLVVLALRLLAFAAVVLAFAQPLLSGGDDGEGARAPRPQRVGIFVDDSYSMSAQASDVPLLEKARQRAREIVRAYPPDAQFQIVRNALDGASSRLVSRDDALAALDDIELAPDSRPVAEVLARFARLGARGADTDGPEATVYLVSDFQRSQFDPDVLAADTSGRTYLVPVAAVVERNVSIDSAWLASPVQLVGEPVELLVELTNHGDADAEAVRVSARAGGRQQPFGTKAVPARTSVVDTLRLAGARAGWNDVAIEITDFPIEFDDRYHVSFPVRERLRVLAIADGAPGPYLAAAFPQGAPLRLDRQRAGNVNYSALGDYDLVVLDDLRAVSSGLAQALTAYVREGGRLVVFPAADAEPAGYNRLLADNGLSALGARESGERRVGRINTDAFVFADVYERLPRNLRLPQTSTRYRLGPRFGESLMTYRDGQPYVVGQTSGAGRVYLAAAPLNPASGDLVRSGEVFVPMLYRMAISGDASRPIAYTVGRNAVASFAVPADAGEAAFRLRGPGGESIPVQRRFGNRVLLSFGAAPGEAGFYRLTDARDSTLAHLAFNFDRRESPQEFLGADALAATGLRAFDGNATGSLEAALRDNDRGRPWWPYLVALALAALLAEALVLRLWRPLAARRPGTPAAASAKTRDAPPAPRRAEPVS